MCWCRGVAFSSPPTQNEGEEQQDNPLPCDLPPWRTTLLVRMSTEWLWREDRPPWNYIVNTYLILLIDHFVLHNSWIPGLTKLKPCDVRIELQLVCVSRMTINATPQLNPLTTDDAIWHRLTLAACYQLAQSVLKLGIALAKRWDRGRWAGFSTECRAHGSCLGWLYKSLGRHWLDHFLLC